MFRNKRTLNLRVKNEKMAGYENVKNMKVNIIRYMVIGHDITALPHLKHAKSPLNRVSQPWSTYTYINK